MVSAFRFFAVSPAANQEWVPMALKAFISTCEANGGFGQVVDAQYLASKAQISLAVANVEESLSDASLQSHSVSIELLLRLAGKRQFNDAVGMGVSSQTNVLAVIAVVPHSSVSLIDNWAKSLPLKKCAIDWKTHLEKNEKRLISFFHLEMVEGFQKKAERLALLKQLVEEKVALALL